MKLHAHTFMIVLKVQPIHILLYYMYISLHMVVKSIQWNVRYIPIIEGKYRDAFVKVYTVDFNGKTRNLQLVS